MRLLDMIPLQQWVEFEKEFNERTGLNSCIIDENGVRITAYRNWANSLCPMIRGENKGLTAICGRIGERIMDINNLSSSPVIAQCEAGLMGVFQPVFSKGKFLGLVGGCGLLPDKGGVNASAVSTATGLGAIRIKTVSRDIGRLQPPEIESLGRYLKRRLREITLTDT